MSNLIMGFREALEAILLIGIIVVFLKKNNLSHLTKVVYSGAFAGVLLSFGIAIALNKLTQTMAAQGELLGKLWEAGSALLASFLILLLVIAMIKNKKNISKEIEGKVSTNLKDSSLFFISLLMVAREGFEIVLFVLANPDKSNIFVEVTTGVVLAIILGLGINKSLFKVNLKTLFKYLLIFLILQVGYLFGYAIHEFIEALEFIEFMPDSFILYNRAYDLSGTFLDQKTNFIGIMLNATVGWYAKPHILQFVGQYAITGYLVYLYKKNA